MKIGFLDFETTGVDAKVCHPIEVAMTIVDMDEKLKDYGSMSWEALINNNVEITKEISEITGITKEMVDLRGISLPEAFSLLNDFLGKCDYVIAHNLAFDQTVYQSTCNRNGFPVVNPSGGWICSIQDVKYPAKFKCKKLSHLAYDHGILVHPDTLHRAVADTNLLSRLILEKYDINEIIAYSKIPWVYIACVTKPPWEDGGIESGRAKSHGFSWEKPWGTDFVFPKRWVKRVKQSELPELAKALSPLKLAYLEVDVR